MLGPPASAAQSPTAATLASPARERSSGGEQGLRYRPDIDGLRAVAIVPVVLYHADVPWFTGGFVLNSRIVESFGTCWSNTRIPSPGGRSSTRVAASEGTWR